jgi:phospholipid transport system substrate-binding protein
MGHSLVARFTLIFVVLLGVVLGSVGVRAESGAVAGIEAFHDSLLAVMKDADKLGYPGRRDRLEPVMGKAFDLPYVAEVVLGRTQWSALTDAQKKSMIETFSAYSVSTYADRFDGYSGEAFETGSERELKRGRVLVRTKLRKSDGDVVELDYVLHKVAGMWKIVNVIHDGISDLSLKRADYGTVIRGEGFEALIAKLNEKIAAHASGAKN